MCLLVVKPENVIISDPLELCRQATEYNPDGWGAAWDTRKAAKHWRAATVTPEQQAQVITQIGPRPAIIHWRYGTSGHRDKANSHPFRLPDGTLWAHNGIMDVTSNPGMSDTRTVSEASQTRKELEFLLTLHLKSNKFAILTHGQPITILGEACGDWEKGVWYSNMYWQTPQYHTTTDAQELSDTIDYLIAEFGWKAVADEVDEHRWGTKSEWRDTWTRQPAKTYTGHRRIHCE